MSFGLGLITGIAESVDRELQLDMKRNLDRIDTLSTLRTNTLTKNREDYETNGENFNETKKHQQQDKYDEILKNPCINFRAGLR